MEHLDFTHLFIKWPVSEGKEGNSINFIKTGYEAEMSRFSPQSDWFEFLIRLTTTTWIFKAGNSTTSSFLVWYRNRQKKGMGVYHFLFFHTIIMPIPIPEQKAGNCVKIQVVLHSKLIPTVKLPELHVGRSRIFWQ